MSKYYTMPTRTPVVSTTSAQMVGQTRTPTALQPPASMTSAQTLETAPMSYTAPIAPARPEEANKSHNPNESADTLGTMSKYYTMPTRTPVVSTTSAQMVGQTRTPKALWRPAPMTSGATVHQHFRTPRPPETQAAVYPPTELASSVARGGHADAESSDDESVSDVEDFIGAWVNFVAKLCG